MRVFAFVVVFACAYLALFVAWWASECRGAWKALHACRRETALIWQRDKLQRALARLREPGP